MEKKKEQFEQERKEGRLTGDVPDDGHHALPLGSGRGFGNGGRVHFFPTSIASTASCSNKSSRSESRRKIPITQGILWSALAGFIPDFQLELK